MPSFLRFAWMLFMQPLTLRAAFPAWEWSLGMNPPLWRLPAARRTGETARQVARQLGASLFLLMPAAVIVVTGLAWALGLEVRWEAALGGIVLGLVTGAAFGVTLGCSVGFVIGMVWAVVGGDVNGGIFGGCFGFCCGLLGGLSADGTPSTARESLPNLLRHALFPGALGTLASAGLWGLVVVEPGSWLQEAGIAGLAFAAFYLVVVIRFPFYIVEAVVMAIAYTLSWSGFFPLRWSVSLTPVRWDDLILFRLPFLADAVVSIGKRDKEAARGLIDKAVTFPALRPDANRALYELQAMELERAARERDYSRTSKLDFTFISSDDTEAVYLFQPFQQAATKILDAKTRYKTAAAKQEALLEASDTLSRLGKKLAGLVVPQAERIRDAHGLWVDVVQKEQEEAPKPIPIPFLAGPVLLPDDESLFRGRSDIISLIRDDLVGNRRGTILLFGQRRMGKSSLVQMLPLKIGKGIRIVFVSFQTMVRGDVPHRHVSAAVADACPDVVSPPQTDDWRDTLAWLNEVDASLRDDGTHLLIAIDEVERLEMGIREGWATTDFLDLVRSSGDNLVHIRFLLTAARSLRALGPHWEDRLINVLRRTVGPLEEEEARDLIQNPDRDFPDIYPDGGVDRIVDITRGHPFLVQLVCDSLCRRLNEVGREKADMDDIERAVDKAISEAENVFHNIWRLRSEEEQAILLDLATKKSGVSYSQKALHALKDEGYVQKRDGQLEIAVPLFARWVSEEMT